jgi:hypothetical protein
MAEVPCGQFGDSREGGMKTPQLGGDARLGAKHSDPHRQIIALAGPEKTTSSN